MRRLQLSRWTLAISVLFICLIFSEGFGLPNGRVISFYLILTAPAILFTIDYQEHKMLTYSHKLTVIGVLYICCLLISSMNAANVQVAIETTIVTLSLLLVGLSAANHPQEIRSVIPPLILVTAALCILYTTLLTAISATGSHWLIPQTGYQVVYYYYGHNHIGDFLALALLVALYRYQQTKHALYLMCVLGIVPFFIVSFSRSAYVAFISTLLIAGAYQALHQKKVRFPKQFLVVTTGIVVVSSIFFFATVREAGRWGAIATVRQTTRQMIQIPQKTFIAKRDELLTESLSAIKANPLFGIGPGNFRYASLKYSSIFGYYSDTSHNVLLDSLVGAGVIGTLVLIVLLVMSLKKAHYTVLTVLLVAIVINMMTDYTFVLYSFCFLTTLLIGSHVTVTKKLTLPSKGWLLPVLPTIFMVLSLISAVFERSKYFEAAFYIYPIKTTVFQPLLTTKFTPESKEFETWENRYNRLFPADTLTRLNLAQQAENKNNQEQSLKYYLQVYDRAPNQHTSLFKKIVKGYITTGNENQATSFIYRVFDHTSQLRNKSEISKNFIFRFDTLCREINDIRCMDKYSAAVRDK